MMEKTLRINETSEGFIAYCQGSSSPFSFLAGQRELSAQKVHDNYLFASQASPGRYMLQLVWPDLHASISDLGGSHDLEILGGYLHYEMEYQKQALGNQLAPDSLGVRKLPTGRQVLTWCSEPADGPSAAEPGDGEDTSGSMSATPYSGFASMRNGRELVVFGIQGLGSGWTRDAVRIKAMRIAFSTFFE
jgi:hypothetical protein